MDEEELRNAVKIKRQRGVERDQLGLRPDPEDSTKLVGDLFVCHASSPNRRFLLKISGTLPAKKLYCCRKIVYLQQPDEKRKIPFECARSVAAFAENEKIRIQWMAVPVEVQGRCVKNNHSNELLKIWKELESRCKIVNREFTPVVVTAEECSDERGSGAMQNGMATDNGAKNLPKALGDGKNASAGDSLIPRKEIPVQVAPTNATTSGAQNHVQVIAEAVKENTTNLPDVRAGTSQICKKPSKDAPTSLRVDAGKSAVAAGDLKAKPPVVETGSQGRCLQGVSELPVEQLNSKAEESKLPECDAGEVAKPDCVEQEEETALGFTRRKLAEIKRQMKEFFGNNEASDTESLDTKQRASSSSAKSTENHSSHSFNEQHHPECPILAMERREDARRKSNASLEASQDVPDLASVSAARPTRHSRQHGLTAALPSQTTPPKAERGFTVEAGTAGSKPNSIPDANPANHLWKFRPKRNNVACVKKVRIIGNEIQNCEGEPVSAGGPTAIQSPPLEQLEFTVTKEELSGICSSESFVPKSIEGLSPSTDTMSESPSSGEERMNLTDPLKFLQRTSKPKPENSLEVAVSRVSPQDDGYISPLDMSELIGSVNNDDGHRIKKLLSNIEFKNQVIRDLQNRLKSLQMVVEAKMQEKVCSLEGVSGMLEPTGSYCNAGTPTEQKNTKSGARAEAPPSDPSPAASVSGTPMALTVVTPTTNTLPICEVLGSTETCAFRLNGLGNELTGCLDFESLQNKAVHSTIRLRLIGTGTPHSYALQACIPRIRDDITDFFVSTCFLQIRFLSFNGLPVQSAHFIFDTHNGTCRKPLGVHSDGRTCEYLTYESHPVINLQRICQHVYTGVRGPDGLVDLVMNTEVRIMILTSRSLAPGEIAPSSTLQDRLEKLILWSRSGCRPPKTIRSVIFLCGRELHYSVRINEHVIRNFSPVFDSLLEESFINGREDIVVLKLPHVPPQVLQAIFGFLHGESSPEEWRGVEFNLEIMMFSCFFLMGEIATKCTENLMNIPDEELTPSQATSILEAGWKYGFMCLVKRGEQWLEAKSMAETGRPKLAITAAADHPENDPFDTKLLEEPCSTVKALEEKPVCDGWSSPEPQENKSLTVPRSLTWMPQDSSSVKPMITQRPSSSSNTASGCETCGQESGGYRWCSVHWNKVKANARKSKVLLCYACGESGHRQFQCPLNKSM